MAAGATTNGWLAGPFLREQLVPLLDRHLTDELDEWAHPALREHEGELRLGRRAADGRPLTASGRRNTATRRSG